MDENILHGSDDDEDANSTTSHPRGERQGQPPEQQPPSSPLTPRRSGDDDDSSAATGGVSSPMIPPTPGTTAGDSVVPPTPAPTNGSSNDGGGAPGTPLTPLSPLFEGGSQEERDDDDNNEQRRNNNNNNNDSDDEEEQRGTGGAGAAAGGRPHRVVDDLEEDDDGAPTAGGGGEVQIRGTDVHVPTVQAAFLDFIRNFRSLKHSHQSRRQQERRQRRSNGRGDDDDDDNSSSSSSSSDSSDSENDDDDDNESLPPPLYLSRLESLLTTGTINNGDDDANNTATMSSQRVSFEIDSMHLFYFSVECQRLYYQLVAFPTEIITLMDLVMKRELERLLVVQQQQQQQQQQDQEDNDMMIMEPEFLPVIQVRPYNLKQVSNLRCLDPVAMDTLVALKGMIVRTSPIIPDLRVAHFTCSMCGNSIQRAIDNGKIVEPHRCDHEGGGTHAGCNARGSFTLIHNRCVYQDKQLVRLQERPDQVPAGQTPASVICFAFDNLVDNIQPGDRVEVTGILKAQPARVHAKLTKLKSVYKTYIDVIHYKQITGMSEKNDDGDSENKKDDTNSKEKDNGKWTASRIEQLRTLSQDPDIYDKLTSSLAPSIWELDNIKKGILCMLFGGNNVRVKKKKNKTNQQQIEDGGGDNEEGDDSWLDDDDDDDGNNNDPGTSAARGKKNNNGNRTLNKRGDINILLCGDPGTSKSQLLSYVNKISSRGVYTSGKGSSAVGLTASVVRDPETRDLVLESGALVLSDRGICCIDEFDKMSDTTRSVLHEAMEQQTVSIAKAGILATLHARTSVLASANPVDSRYNPSMSVVDNIQLPPTLLSRFDLIYLILDSPNVENDRKLAQHLVGLYYETPNVVEPPVDQALLRDYIEYARENIHPEITDEASQQLITSYLEMRSGGNYSSNNGGGASAGMGMMNNNNGTRTISATPRQLESLIRLSEALAKMRYSDLVTRADTLEAVRLMKVATQTAATDPRTGRIDMDMITTGRSSSDREHEELLTTTLKELLAERRGTRMAIRDVIKQLSEITNNVSGGGGSGAISHQEVLDLLRQMEADGLIQLNERAQTIFVRTGIVR